ncbi:MAG: hypothetical protein ACI9RO_002077 [Alteromonas macleodii]|jgi:hypothetical protein
MQPVFIMGPDVGNCVAVDIHNITVTLITTKSGHDNSPDGLCLVYPYVRGAVLHVILSGQTTTLLTALRSMFPQT